MAIDLKKTHLLTTPLRLTVPENTDTSNLPPPTHFSGDGKAYQLQLGKAFETPPFSQLPQHSLLTINPDGFSHYAVSKSREAGEAELSALAKNPDSAEEAWVYIKGTRDGKNISDWYEIGFGEEKQTVAVDDGALKKALEKTQVQEVSIYHIHPLETNAEHKHCYEAPSPNDYINTIQRATELIHSLPENALLDFRIITPQGKVVITPNLGFIKKSSPEENKKLPNKSFDDFFRYDWEITQICTNPEEYIPKLSTDYLKLTYEKF